MPVRLRGVRSLRVAAALLVATSGVSFGAAALLAAGSTPLPSTVADFQQPGTQPNTLNSPIDGSWACQSCHAGYDEAQEPYARWHASMMGQAGRDPIFYAGLAIAQQDAPGSGDLCLRCHAPGAWLADNTTPPDGSTLAGDDFDGVNCHFCHRMVDPVADPANPLEDTAILGALAQIPTEPHSGQFVVDPDDNRRGPFLLDPGFFWHEWRESSFHQESLLCGTCHDVSNPAFDRVGGAQPRATDTYLPGTWNAPHTTADKYDQFPVERTYSEWSESAFAVAPVELGGRFGGNKTAVASCQDCHMPDTSGEACKPGYGAIPRTDLPLHDFNGANSWVLNGILELDQTGALYPISEGSGLTQPEVDAAIARNVSLLERASDLELTASEDALRVRILNYSGHKLPTGYGEGRRMWVHAVFRDSSGAVIAEHGAYDDATATLTTADTKVYEIKHGIDAAVSSATGVPVGESFHFVLNNTIEKDNRIPPLGFTNAGFEAVQSHPVAASYADGQHWDDTLFDIPCGAVEVEVEVFHQTTTREYAEFLRDENTTNSAGLVAYQLWQNHGRSAPVRMDHEVLDLGPRLAADVSSISLATGGVQSLCLSASASHAGDIVWILGSASGTSPGLPVFGYTLPLNYDGYLQFTLGSPGVAPLVGGLTVLNAQGRATAGFVLPAGLTLPPGLVLHHAFGVIGTSLEGVSNAVPVELVP